MDALTQFLMLQGVAGSGKTRQLVLFVIHFLQTVGKPVLLITKCSSVTVELIERLESMLDIKFKKLGDSNHYTARFKRGCPIVVSNFDAWVHLMCKKLDLFIDEKKEGNMYDVKVDRLLKYIRNDGADVKCYLKNEKDNVTASLIAIDEAQDLTLQQMEIVTRLAQRNGTHVYIGGDVLQTLDRKVARWINPMSMFKNLQPTMHTLQECKRCPKEHVEFANMMTPYASHGLQPMTTTKEPSPHRVFLFALQAMTHTAQCEPNAKCVTDMVKILFKHDPTLRPNDVAFIMPSVKDSKFYPMLHETLQKMYKAEYGWSDCIAVMQSQTSEGDPSTLDWANAEGKTKLMSINASKGRQFRVVFFLGFSENSLPSEDTVNKTEELSEVSKMYVALTRSTEYLFVSFTALAPSRYLWQKRSLLAHHAYCAWENSTHMPAPYNMMALQLAATQNAHVPNWNYKYKMLPSLGGSKTKLAIRDHIGNDIGLHLLYPSFSFDATEFVFGQPLHFPSIETSEQRMIMGLMSNLLMERKLSKAKLTKFLLPLTRPERVQYSNNTTILASMHDLASHFLPRYATRDGDPSEALTAFFKECQECHLKPEEKTMISRYVQLGLIVLNGVFNNDMIREHVLDFISDKPNEALSPVCIWNVTLLHSQLTQQIFRPIWFSYLNYFHDDLTGLHANIDQLVLCKPELQFNCSFEYSVHEGTYITEIDQLKELQKTRPYAVDISGRCDIWNRSAQEVVEIKASASTQCSTNWITQTLMYGVMLRHYGHQINRLSVINIMQGKGYGFDISGLSTNLLDIVTRVIAPYYEWHSLETAAFAQHIMRKAHVQDNATYEQEPAAKRLALAYA
jgi:hypothetical protein